MDEGRETMPEYPSLTYSLTLVRAQEWTKEAGLDIPNPLNMPTLTVLERKEATAA